MSPRTLFLSRLIGLYCIFIALSMMARRQATVETVTALLQNPSMMLDVDSGHNDARGWAGGGSCSQYLVGRCARGCGHPRRLDNAHQESILLIPAACDGNESFSSAASLPATLLLVRSYFASPRRVSDLQRIQVNVALACVSPKL